MNRRGIDWRRFKFAHGYIERPKTLRCIRPACRNKIAVPERGRLPEYCSQACRQRAYEIRRRSRPRAVELMASDIMAVRIREEVRKQIQEILQASGARSPSAPPKRKRNAKLTVILGGLESEKSDTEDER